MNQLIIPDGGMPLEGDDIRWMYQGLLEAMKGGALYPFALQHSGNFIITGCEISFAGGNASITEGFVMLNYEICFCPAHTVAVTSLAASSLKVLETYDASGAEVFADSITRDTYAIRRARISNGLNSGIEIVLANPPRYYYQKVIVNGDLSSSFTVVKPVKITLCNGIVYWEGSVQGGLTNSDLIGSNVLPSVLVPSANRLGIVSGPGEYVVVAAFSSVLDGRVVLGSMSDNQLDFTSTELYLDGIIYRV
jgi:hypothetical protein